MNKIKEFFANSKTKLIASAPVAAVGLTTVAFAETTPTSVSTVTGAMGDAFSMVGTIIGQIASQPILLFQLAVSFIPIGIRVFKMLKGAAHK